MNLHTLRNKLIESLLKNGKTSSFKRDNDNMRYRAYLSDGLISVCCNSKGKKVTMTWDTFLYIWLENMERGVDQNIFLDKGKRV